MSRRRAAVVPFALVRAMLLAAAAERSAATKGAACSCYSCGQVQEPGNAELTHNSALSQTYRACEARGECLLRAHAISHIMVELRREQAVEFTSFMYGPAIGYECRWRPSGPMQHKARSAASRKSFASAIAALPAGGFRDAHCTPQKKRS